MGVSGVLDTLLLFCLQGEKSFLVVVDVGGEIEGRELHCDDQMVVAAHLRGEQEIRVQIAVRGFLAPEFRCSGAGQAVANREGSPTHHYGVVGSGKLRQFVSVHLQRFHPVLLDDVFGEGFNRRCRHVRRVRLLQRCLESIFQKRRQLLCRRKQGHVYILRDS